MSRGIISVVAAPDRLGRPALAACLLVVLLGACEVHKPADRAALGQADAPPTSQAPDLLGGPSRPARMAAFDTGFVLLGGPVPAARTASAPADAASRSTAPGADARPGAGPSMFSTGPASGAVARGYGAPRPAAAARPSLEVASFKAASFKTVSTSASPDPLADGAPLETELLTPASLRLDTGPAPAAAAPADLPAGGRPDGIGFGRIFSFLLCVMGAAAVWRWRGVLLERQAAEASSSSQG